ncbi:MAG: ABC transporter permease [Verrucomicrobia bacterium]|nr:ABC transporter permease [Verrucomicrobiota bacterium]
MNTIFTLLRKDCLTFWRDPLAVVLTFAVPAVLILIFGMAFSGGGGPSGIRLLIVNETEDSPIASGIIQALQQESTFQVHTHRTLPDGSTIPLDRSRAEYLLRSNPSTFRYALIIPENLVPDSFGLHLEWLYNPQNSIENGIVQGMLQKVLFSNAFPLLIQDFFNQWIPDELAEFDENLASVISQFFPVSKEDLEGNLWPFNQTPILPANNADSDQNFLENLIALDGTQIFGNQRNPATQSVAGFAVMFVLFSLSGAASSLFYERDKHIFLRLLSGNVSRGQILFSKFIFCSLLGLLQMAALITFGHIVFDIISSPHQLLPLALISLFTACAATAFGMLLAAIAKTPATANGLGSFIILSMSALGGAMFPLFLMPAFMRDFIAPLTLVFWGVDGALGVLWRDASITDLWLHFSVLAFITCAILAFAKFRFDRSDIFR